jgi:23S rRNA (uracil1939-C5)-methyltransferase
LLLTIEKLIYGGDGLARLPDDPKQSDHRGRGKAAFIPFVLPGEKVEATLTENKPGFARARAEAIVEPSPHRVSPACPYFSHCGGCHYQHINYDQQLEIKKEILRENLRRIAKIELQCEVQAHPSPPWNYRNRSRLQVQTKPTFAAGYFKFASHELLPVEQCPISSPLINRAIAAQWQAGRENKVPDGIREVEFFADAEDQNLLLELLCAPGARRSAVRAFAEELCASMPQISGVSAFRTVQSGVPEQLISVGVQHLIYKTRQTAFRVSAGSFFQTNRFLTDQLIDIVTAAPPGDSALDLYAGVGLFSTALACSFRHITAVESSQTATNDLAYNLPTNGRAIRCATGLYLSTGSGSARADAGDWPAQSHSDAHGELRPGRVGKGKIPLNVFHTPDLIVVDPPRGGLGDRVAHALANSHAPRVTYVSCDPATLARDLIPLQAAGYRVEQVHLVDLFPQTYHLESVVQLVR